MFEVWLLLGVFVLSLFALFEMIRICEFASRLEFLQVKVGCFWFASLMLFGFRLVQFIRCLMLCFIAWVITAGVLDSWEAMP